MHQRPSAALLELDDPYKNWTRDDYKLQEAVKSLERETCKSCGNPIWLCHSPSNLIDFDIRRESCYATIAIAEYEDDKSNPELEKGETLHAVAIGVKYDDGEQEKLPTRAEGFALMARSDEEDMNAE